MENQVNTHDNKQSGLRAVVSIVIIVLVIALIGFIGWRVYSQSSKQATDASSSNHTSASSTIPQSTYLDIKELGIKIKLDNSIKDAVYSYSPAAESPPQHLDIGGVNLSTQSLIDRDQNCNPVSGGNPLGSINELFINQDELGNKLRPNGTTIFKLGNNYYILSTPQSPCSTNSSVNTLAGQQRATFFNDFKTVQLDH